MKKVRIRKYSIVWWLKQLAVPALCLGIIMIYWLAETEAAAYQGDTEKPEETIVLEEEPVDMQEVIKPEPESLGVFTITHYCRENYPHICNNGDATQTATGTVPTPGRTIAADPDVIPYGTTVLIDGHEYVVEDCGGAIKDKRIDILVDTHAEALSLGIYETEVYAKVEEYHDL